MKTEVFFAIMLIITTLVYSIRVVGWVLFVIRMNSKKTKEQYSQVLNESTLVKSKRQFYIGGIEHFFIMFSLIGSIIVLL